MFTRRIIFASSIIIGLMLFVSSHGSAFAQENEVKEQTSDSTQIQEVDKKVERKTIVKDPNRNSFGKNWYLGFKGGATFFLSPLKDNPFSWGASATLGKQLNTKIALRLDYLYGNLQSEGEFVKRNTDGSFYKNDLVANVDFMEIALLMNLSLNDFFYSSSPKHLRELYLFGGAAYTMFRSEITDKEGEFVTGAGYDVEGNETDMISTIAIPIGIGVTYRLDKKDIFNINAEFGYRFAQTDQLDARITETASNYTYSSLGLLVNLGQPTVSPQTITSDLVRDQVNEEIGKKVDKEINSTIDKEIKPLREELAKQSVAVVDNQNQLEILQEEMEARLNAIKEHVDNQDGLSAVGGLNISSVYFAFNSTYITPAMEREIATIAEVLKKNEKIKCEIVGNSSNVGSPEYNKQLSLKRANAVMALLTDEFGVEAERLTVINNGIEDPLAENIRKINRRVDMILK